MDIKLKHVRAEPDRFGNIRYYFRKDHGPRIRLRPPPGTPEFMEAYNLASRGIDPAKPQARPKRIKPANGTLRHLCDAYMSAPEFRSFELSTQTVRGGILNRLCNSGGEDGASPYGDRPAGRMEPRHVRKIRDSNSDRPEAANGIIKALRQVFAYAIDAEIPGIKTNPARDVPYPKSKGQGFHSWTIEEIEQFEKRHPIGTKARLALAIMIYTGQRRADIIRVGPPMVREGWITITQHKGRNTKPVTLEIPIVRSLQTILDRTPDAGPETWLVTQFGKPFTSNGFGNWFRKRCDEAELPQCSAHGLRKAAASRLAEIGCTDREIMAITGHTTSKEVDRYTSSGARQRTLAATAMSRISVGEGDEPVTHLRAVKSRTS